MSSCDLFISPHPDDICYSAFLAITQRDASSPAVIVTLFSQSCWTFLSTLQRQDAMQVTHMRRDEELAFAGFVNANVDFLDLPDTSLRCATFGDEYRLAPTEDFIYETARAKLSDVLRRRESIATIYAPLGISGHVDHLIARDIMLGFDPLRHRLLLYEDLPYVARYNDKAITSFAARLPGQPRPELRTAPSPQRKIDAMRLYRSQLEPNTVEVVIGYGMQRSEQTIFAERYWRL
jgi:LmbE family N-acetylglucosaminyl deacetylase